EGDVLSTAIANAGISRSDATEILRELRRYKNLNRIQVGDFFEVRYTCAEHSDWMRLSYYTRGTTFVRVTKRDGVITGEQRELPVVQSTRAVRGTITSSLWNAMIAEGLNPNMVVSFADIFAWQVDFLTGTRPGDEFKIIYEQTLIPKQNRVASSRIIAARYTSRGRTHTAINYENLQGQRGFFDEQGNSMRRQFLRAPLQYRRISSHFGMRMHPILRVRRQHAGTDFAAPTGTPVSAIGDGVVTRASYDRNNGNIVIIRHPNGFESYYLHLSRFARGIRPGVRVRQGQLIGYVGATGLATGPHLCFRMRHNGRFINFLTMRQPSLESLSGADRTRFLEYSKPIVAKLNSLGTGTTTSLPADDSSYELCDLPCAS
ncbi:MAG: M23 family metallopeptidase, partial [Elusimicrobia bacterium]|nr:M23 family metallopeptidase [Elusimicrobiota bacterium]